MTMSKYDKRIADDMRNFAKSVKKVDIPPKSHKPIIDEYVYEAPVSVRQKPVSRVMYMEDLVPDPIPVAPPVVKSAPSADNVKPHHNVPRNDPTANLAIANADREASRKPFEKKPKKKPTKVVHKPVTRTLQNNNPPVKDEGVVKVVTPPVYQPIPNKLPAVSDTPRSISKVSNLIRDHLQQVRIFGELKFGGKQRVWEENFYRDIGSAIYHSLLQFLSIERYEDGKDPATGRQLWGYNIPEMKRDIPYISSWYFFDRIYHNTDVSFETDASVMDKYREVFEDHDGIDIEWLELFRNALKRKFYHLSNTGINLIIDTVRDVWCTQVDSDNEGEPEEVIDASITQVFPAPTEYVHEVVTSEEYRDDEEDYDDTDDDEDEDGDDDDTTNNINIELDQYNGLDKITIIPRDKTSITFYTKLGEISTEIDEVKSLADSRNGMWDWLMHFVPNMIFTTLEPEKYFVNSIESIPTTKIIALDETDGLYTMGVYYVDPDFGNELEEDGSIDIKHCNFIQQINNLVNRELGSSTMSHRNISLVMEDLFWEEEEILEYIESDDEEDDDSTEDVLNSSSFDEAIKIAQHIGSGIAELIFNPDSVVSNIDEDEDSDKDVQVEEDDSAPDPDDDPPYPGTTDVGPKDEESDFVFTPISRSNKYNT